MSEQTCSSKPVLLEHAEIVIGGTKIPAFIEGEIHFTYTHYPAQNMGGRMEDAIPSDEEVVLDEVELTVMLLGKSVEKCVEGYHGDITFVTNCKEFYEEHFGELDCMDVIGYT